MASHGADNETADRYCEQWFKEDTYCPIDLELDAMSAAVSLAHCIWYLGLIAVSVDWKTSHC